MLGDDDQAFRAVIDGHNKSDSDQAGSQTMPFVQSSKARKYLKD